MDLCRSWSWALDGRILSADEQPVFSNLSQGAHQLTLSVSNVYDCMSDTITKNFSILPTPAVTFEAKDGCWKQPLNFFGHQVDSVQQSLNGTGNLAMALTRRNKILFIHIPRQVHKILHLTVNADDGCVSNDITKQIHIEDIYVDAGNDTSVQANIPLSLTQIGLEILMVLQF